MRERERKQPWMKAIGLKLWDETKATRDEWWQMIFRVLKIRRIKCVNKKNKDIIPKNTGSYREVFLGNCPKIKCTYVKGNLNIQVLQYFAIYFLLPWNNLNERVRRREDLIEDLLITTVWSLKEYYIKFKTLVDRWKH